MSRVQRSLRAGLFMAVVLLAATAACGTDRGPTAIVEVAERSPGELEVIDNPSTDVDATEIDETATTVVVEAIGPTLSGDVQPACLGQAIVALGRPLGDRAVIDALTGEPVTVLHRAPDASG